MAGFQFRSTKISVEILDKKYVIDLTTEIQQKFDRISRELFELAESTAKGEKSGEEVFDRLAEFFDTALGVGAHDEIFAGRPKLIADYLDLVNYLAEKINDRTGIGGQNRAQRRNQGK